MPISNATAVSRSAPTSNASCLMTGDSGPRVASVQNQLAALGFDPRSGTPVDGQFGPNTQAAVKAFQRSQGLKPDGIVGPDTLKALANPKPLAAKPAPKPAAASDGFEAAKTPAPVKISAPPPPAAGDVVAAARGELGRNAADVKVGHDAIGEAMRDDVSNWKCCANFVGASLRAAGQIKDKDLSASVDGLVAKLEKTGNFTESHSLEDCKPGDVVAFDHAHVMICTGRNAKGELTFIGSNNDKKDGSQKISEGPLSKWFAPNSKTLKAWTENVVVMHYNK